MNIIFCGGGIKSDAHMGGRHGRPPIQTAGSERARRVEEWGTVRSNSGL